jgi:hypothetical protein
LSCISRWALTDCAFAVSDSSKQVKRDKSMFFIYRSKSILKPAAVDKIEKKDKIERGWAFPNR